MKRQQTNRTPSREGFSLIEAIFAAALVLLITVGIMPLFTNSIINTLEGKESTISTNDSRSGAEEFYQLPLDRQVLRPPIGVNERLVCLDKADTTDGWDLDECDPADVGTYKTEWLSTGTIRQYNINEIYNLTTASEIRFDNPTPGYDPVASAFLDSYVHIREISMVTLTQREEQSPFGPGPTVDIVTLRGF